MANYGLVQTAVYQPFTYDELTKPLILATQYQRDVEKEYGDAILEAEHWRDLADATNNPLAHLKYKEVMSKVNSLADKLVKYGVTPQSNMDAIRARGLVRAMDKNFQEAFDTYKEAVKYRNENPGYYLNTLNGWDKLLGGKQVDLTRVTPKELFEDSKYITSNIIASSPTIKGEKLKGVNGYITIDEAMGLSPKEFAEVLKNNPTSELAAAVRAGMDLVAKRYLIDRYNKLDRDRMIEDINAGAYSALAKHEFKPMEDKDYITPTVKYQERMANYRASLAHSGPTQNNGGRRLYVQGPIQIQDGKVTSTTAKNITATGKVLPTNLIGISSDRSTGQNYVTITPNGMKGAIIYNMNNGEVQYYFGGNTYNNIEEAQRVYLRNNPGAVGSFNLKNAVKNSVELARNITSLINNTGDPMSYLQYMYYQSDSTGALYMVPMNVQYPSLTGGMVPGNADGTGSSDTSLAVLQLLPNKYDDER